MDESIIFKYENSYLAVKQLVDKEHIELIDQCVEDIEKFKLLDFEPPITMRGRICNQRRNIGFVSTQNISGYRYSSQISKSKPIPESFVKLIEEINKIYNSTYNSILINEYTDGSKYIGRHSDDQNKLNKNSGVVALSVGASRKFVFRKVGEIIDADGKSHIPPMLFTYNTNNYELMQMGGKFQSELTHEIPKQLKIKNSRISFTFREHYA